MAGDWLKVEKGLTRKREVLLLAEMLELDTRYVAGLCFEFWDWVDDNTTDGVIRCHAGVTLACTIDRIMCANGFASALETVGWLRIESDGISIPNFDRHNGKSAKRRALGRHRQQSYRSRKRNARRVTNASPEKRREEYIEKMSTSSPAPAPEEKKPRAPDPVWDTVCAAWNLNPEVHRTRIGKAVRDFKTLEATPDDIRTRLNRYRRGWPNAVASPEALIKHWGEFAADPPTQHQGGPGPARVGAVAGKYDGLAKTVVGSSDRPGHLFAGHRPEPGADRTGAEEAH